jgi:hypothetical protein
MDRHCIRLRFAASPDATQLEMLRATFPHLAELAPSTLRERLSERPVVVLRGVFSRVEGDAVVKQLADVGLEAELFGNDYGLPYLRRTLPAPNPTWEPAETALEVVFRPSFTPEVIVRLWTHESRARLQLGSLNTHGIRCTNRCSDQPPHRSRSTAWPIDPSGRAESPSGGVAG